MLKINTEGILPVRRFNIGDIVVHKSDSSENKTVLVVVGYYVEYCRRIEVFAWHYKVSEAIWGGTEGDDFSEDDLVPHSTDENRFIRYAEKVFGITRD